MITKEQQRILDREFGPDEIEFVEKRRGAGKLAYVSHPACTRRLTEAFPEGWSFEILETRIDGTTVAVLVRISAGGVVKESWDSASSEYTDLGDSLKSAQSCALRKAASLFGVALHLWEDPPKPGQQRAVKPKEESKPKPDIPSGLEGCAPELVSLLREIWQETRLPWSTVKSHYEKQEKKALKDLHPSQYEFLRKTMREYAKAEAERMAQSRKSGEGNTRGT